MAAQPESWPLSAAATEVLRNLDASGGDVLKLSLKELVLRGSFAIEQRKKKGMFGSKDEPWLVPREPKAASLPPVDVLEPALRRVVPAEGAPVKQAVQKLVRSHTTLGKNLRDRALAELQARGLIEMQARKVLFVTRHKPVRTQSGDLWAQRAMEWEQALTINVGSLPTRDLAAMAAGAAAIVLLLQGPVMQALSGRLTRRRRGHYDSSGAWVDDDYDDDDYDVEGMGEMEGMEGMESLEGIEGLDGLEGLDSLDSLDSSFDSAVESGGGGDGGGDGGGNGGGGGD
jgi:hypothetical protein